MTSVMSVVADMDSSDTAIFTGAVSGQGTTSVLLVGNVPPIYSFVSGYQVS